MDIYKAYQDIFNNSYDETLHLLKTQSSVSAYLSTETFNKEEVASVTTVYTMILSSSDVAEYRNKTFTLKNEGSGILTECIIQGSPNNVDWEDLESIFFAGLASGEMKSFQISLDSRRYWRIIGKSSTSCTIKSWLVAAYI